MSSLVCTCIEAALGKPWNSKISERYSGKFSEKKYL
jgi:hypothetical protein